MVPHAIPRQPGRRLPARGQSRARLDLHDEKRRPGPPQLAHVARAALWHFLRVQIRDGATRDSARPSGPIASWPAGNQSPGTPPTEAQRYLTSPSPWDARCTGAGSPPAQLQTCPTRSQANQGADSRPADSPERVSTCSMRNAGLDRPSWLMSRQRSWGRFPACAFENLPHASPGQPLRRWPAARQAEGRLRPLRQKRSDT